MLRVCSQQVNTRSCLATDVLVALSSTNEELAAAYSKLFDGDNTETNINPKKSKREIWWMSQKQAQPAAATHDATLNEDVAPTSALAAAASANAHSGEGHDVQAEGRVGRTQASTSTCTDNGRSTYSAAPCAVTLAADAPTSASSVSSLPQASPEQPPPLAFLFSLFGRKDAGQAAGPQEVLGGGKEAQGTGRESAELEGSDVHADARLCLEVLRASARPLARMQELPVRPAATALVLSDELVSNDRSMLLLFHLVFLCLLRHYLWSLAPLLRPLSLSPITRP